MKTAFIFYSAFGILHCFLAVIYMNGELKKRLDELAELTEGGYITDEEYSAARVNLLLDAGFDIVPRPAGSPLSDTTPRCGFPGGAEFDGRMTPAARRGRILGLRAILLIAAIIAGCAFAASRVIRSEEQRNAIRASFMRFWDDLRGNTAEGEPGSLNVPMPLSGFQSGTLSGSHGDPHEDGAAVSGLTSTEDGKADRETDEPAGAGATEQINEL